VILSKRAIQESIFIVQGYAGYMKRLSFWFLLLIPFLAAAVYSGGASAEDSSSAAREYLMGQYHNLEEKLAKSPFALPLYLESSVGRNASNSDIFSVVDYPLEKVTAALRVPKDWCDIVLLHIGVRVCTHRKVDGDQLLTVYNVNKYYETLDDAYQVKFRFRILSDSPGYFKVSLVAPRGPFHAKDLSFDLEATPLNGNSTLIHLSYHFEYSLWEHFAMNTYFALFGGGRVGFTLTGTKHEKPVYVSGLRGAVERNVVRYYLAILAYLDTMDLPQEQRFEKRINCSYDLISRYRRQFHEMNRETYLQYKSQDRINQQRLQRESSR
jgi:hypothetical protein